ncbi:HNH endonuclease [uncultured archaeon]|nr:HNH endonuclease [uncultured archaeon]
MSKMIYEKPIWKLLEEFAAAKGEKTFTYDDILEWFEKNYSKINKSSVKLHIISCSVNNPQRINYSVKKDILFKLENGNFKKYDSTNDGLWIGGGQKEKTEIDDESSSPRNLKQSNNHDNNYSSKMNKSKRTILNNSMRMRIWRRFWGNNMDGKCVVCELSIAVETFEAGHIVSVAKGGGDDILNFAPICKGCNSGMRTENMMDYKNRVYPHIHVKSLVNFP